MHSKKRTRNTDRQSTITEISIDERVPVPNAANKTKLQSLITSFFRNNNGHVMQDSSNTTSMSRVDCNVLRADNSVNVFEITSLPIFYDNVRSITNKRNVCMKIELSLYKVICMTETKLDDGITSSVYFPSNFQVYRCDRKVINVRRAGGVAILVHHTLKSKQIVLSDTVDIDPISEFLAVEIIVRPQPLIIYLCYMSMFNYESASKHYVRIETIVEKYRDHKIMILGDFNLHDIDWTTALWARNFFFGQKSSSNSLNDKNTRFSDFA